MNPPLPAWVRHLQRERVRLLVEQEKLLDQLEDEQAACAKAVSERHAQLLKARNNPGDDPVLGPQVFYVEGVTWRQQAEHLHNQLKEALRQRDEVRDTPLATANHALLNVAIRQRDEARDALLAAANEADVSTVLLEKGVRCVADHVADMRGRQKATIDHLQAELKVAKDENDRLKAKIRDSLGLLREALNTAPATIDRLKADLATAEKANADTQIERDEARQVAGERHDRCRRATELLKACTPYIPIAREPGLRKAVFEYVRECSVLPEVGCRPSAIDKLAAALGYSFNKHLSTRAHVRPFFDWIEQEMGTLRQTRDRAQTERIVLKGENDQMRQALWQLRAYGRVPLMHDSDVAYLCELPGLVLERAPEMKP